MDPLDQAPAVFEIEFLLVLLDLVDDFYADPAAAFAANRDFYLGFPAQFPGWYFAAPGVTTHAAAMAANPQFFLRYPGALDPLAGPEVLLNDAFNPWIEVAPRRNLRSRRDDRPPPEVYPEAPPVEVSQGVPWYPPRIRYRRYVRKHYVVRKGGRTNLQKAYQARKGSFTSSPNGGPGHFVYGSYGAGGCLEY